MKKQKGITLVALIITIIIMLILVAVSVNVIIKSNLIGTAEKASKYTKNATIAEKELSSGGIQVGELWYDTLEDVANNKPSSNQGNLEKTVSKYRTIGIYAGEQITLEDDEKNKMVLPAEFKIARDSGTTVYAGVVIEDEEGNQYVWVPVTKDAEGGNTTPYAETGKLANGTEIKLSRYAFNSQGVESDQGEAYVTSTEYYGNYDTPT